METTPPGQAANALAAIQADLLRVSEAALSHTAGLATLVELIRQRTSINTEVLESFKAALNPVLVVTDEVRNALAQLQLFFEDASRRLPAAIKLASEMGWFVQLEYDLPVDWAELIALGERADRAGIDAWMENRTRRNLDEIESALLSEFEDRSSVLAAAFEAHRDRKYALSIPTMLAQADGIYFDIFGGARQRSDLFHKKAPASTVNKDRRMSRVGEPARDDVLFYQSFEYANAMSLPTHERDTKRAAGQPVSPLNRHGVLHGLDLDYDSESNSLRAIALLDFLRWAYDDLNFDRAGQ